MSDGYIYTLIDPRDNKPFYVGRTTRKPHTRNINHRVDVHNVFRFGHFGSPKSVRLFEIAYETGLYHDFRLVAECDKSEVVEQEKLWTRVHENYGYFLVNSESKRYWELRVTGMRQLIYKPSRDALMKLREGTWYKNESLVRQSIELYKTLAAQFPSNPVIDHACNIQIAQCHDELNKLAGAA